MKKSEDFQSRELNKSNKQDLKAIYIKEIVEKKMGKKGLTALQIVDMLEQEGIIVEYHYVSRIIRLLRDEYGLPITEGNGHPYKYEPQDAYREVHLITIQVDSLDYIDVLKNRFPRNQCTIQVNPDGKSFTFKVETEVKKALMELFMQLGSHIKTIDPPEVLNTYKQYLQNIINKY